VLKLIFNPYVSPHEFFHKAQVASSALKDIASQEVKEFIGLIIDKHGAKDHCSYYQVFDTAQVY